MGWDKSKRVRGSGDNLIVVSEGRLSELVNSQI